MTISNNVVDVNFTGESLHHYWLTVVKKSGLRKPPGIAF
jgi:hypothetical protein